METKAVPGLDSRKAFFIKMGLLYSRMKVFHFKDKLNSLPRCRDTILAPIHVRIKPTNACNHNCWYCAYRMDNLQLGRDMNSRDFIPKEKMLEIIDDLIGMKVKSVTFSGGGEPFCYPYLLDAVKKLSQSPVKFASLTNGARLKDQIAEIFSAKASWVRISLDGWDDKSYSTYRGVAEGEFSWLMENIRSFKRYKGKCYLGTSIIVDNKNVTHLYELIKKLRDSGVDSVKVSPCFISNSIKENNEYHQPIFNQAKEQIAQAKTKLSSDKFEIYDSYDEQMENFQKDYAWCPYLQILPVIGADLNIYPCQDKAYNLQEGLIGSIKNQGFKEFWFSDKNNFFKINPSLHCQHHCIANGKNKMILEYLGADKEHLEFV